MGLTNGPGEDKAAEKTGKVIRELGRSQVSVHSLLSYCVGLTLELNQRHIKFSVFDESCKI